MENTQIGLVLKRFLPYRQKVSILNKTKGKICLITIPSDLIRKLWPGMLIEYNSINENIKTVVSSNKVNIIAIPTNISAKNIKWLHNLLEISYYSLPPGIQCIETFELLCHAMLLLSKQDIFKTQFQLIKKIYLLKLLHILCLWPSTNNFIPTQQQIQLLSSIFIDFSNEQKVKSVKVTLKNIEKETKEKIDQWIMQSMINHPLYKNFKIIYFQR